MENWKSDLSNFFEKREKKRQKIENQLKQKSLKAEHFYKSVVYPALGELKTELEKHGRRVTVVGTGEFAGIRVNHKGKEEYSYNVIVSIIPGCLIPFTLLMAFGERTKSTLKKQGTFKEVGKNIAKSSSTAHSLWIGGQKYDISEISNISKENIISRFLQDYKTYLG